MKQYALLLLFIACLSGCSPDVSEPPAGLSSTPSAEAGQEWIGKEASHDLKDMRMAWCGEVDLKADGSTQLVSLYVQAPRMADGSFAFDDGQNWALLVESEDGLYPLFPRSYVQLGAVSCQIFREMEDGGALRVQVKCSEGAGMEIYDCVYDPEKDAFLREPVYSAGNISSFGGSDGLRDEFWNPKVTRYGEFLNTLPRESKEEIQTAFEALKPMMPGGEILSNEAVDAFLAFHRDLVYSLEPDAEYDPYTGITAELTAEYAPYFIWLYQSEGSLNMEPDIAGIASVLEGCVDWDYQAYFELAKWRRAKGLDQIASDAGLVVSWNQLADLIAEYQRFVYNHSEFAGKRDLDNFLGYYIRWYLDAAHGLDNTPIADKNGLLPDVKASYEYFLDTYPNSALHGLVTEAYDIWRENDWKSNAEVREKLSGIVEEYSAQMSSV